MKKIKVISMHYVHDLAMRQFNDKHHYFITFNYKILNEKTKRYSHKKNIDFFIPRLKNYWYHKLYGHILNFFKNNKPTSYEYAKYIGNLRVELMRDIFSRSSEYKKDKEFITNFMLYAIREKELTEEQQIEWDKKQNG